MSSPSPTPKAAIVVPEIQAGGGAPASHRVLRKVETFSSTVLSYLKAISNGEWALCNEQLQELRGQTSAEPPKDGQEQEKVDLVTFQDYMSSERANAMLPAEELDLSYPISSYFISSSHNSYLSGHQLWGEASAEVYRNILVRGCRCVEIDVWDGDQKEYKGEDEENDDEEKRGRFRKFFQKRFTRHRSGSPLEVKEQNQTQEEMEVKEGTKPEETVETPAKWTSASMATRAEPRVLHGYTLTKEVSFRDVCAAIRDAAFVTSDLPVIVSLETHASPEQQEIMVEIMEDAWEGLLVPAPSEENAALPTPAELKGKILVKVKAAPVQKPETIPEPELAKVQEDTSSSSEDESKNIDVKQEKKSKIIEELSSLGIYTRSYHFKTLNEPEATVPTHIFSLSEKKLMDVHQNQGPQLFSHNRDFMMRTYPSGTRVSSSNLDPTFFWRKGVQIVALNWQRFDAGVMLNEAQFAGTGGWVLKPEGFRAGTAPTAKDPTTPENMPKQDITYKPVDLTIEILAAQDLPMPKGETKPARLRPYVKCELHAECSGDRTTASGEGGKVVPDCKKRTKSSKGDDPDFGGESMHFAGMDVIEDLSFLRFKIKNETVGKDELIAWACIRLDRLCNGFRFVHLLDEKGIESLGALLVNVTRN